jgi:hypothetical protein
MNRRTFLQTTATGSIATLYMATRPVACLTRQRVTGEVQPLGQAGQREAWTKATRKGPSIG